jgi:hypothetical protein
MPTSPPTTADTVAPVVTMAQGLGHTVLGVAENIAPVAVPFVLAMCAIRWALVKFGVDGSAGLGGMESANAKWAKKNGFGYVHGQYVDRGYGVGGAYDRADDEEYSPANVRRMRKSGEL